MQAACKAAAVLNSPGLAVLQLCRQQGVHVSGAAASGLGPQGLWPLQDCSSVQETFRQQFAVLLKLATWQDACRMDVLGSPSAQVGGGFLLRRSGRPCAPTTCRHVSWQPPYCTIHAMRLSSLWIRASLFPSCADVLLLLLAVRCRNMP
jgi:hypothetical protein